MPVQLNAQVKNPALQKAATELVNSPKVDGKSIGTLVASFSSSQGASALDNLKSGKLPPDQMLPIAQKAVDAQTKSDLTALLGDAAFTGKLDATSLNFLKAVVGLEPLRTGGVFGGSATTSVGGPDSPQTAAVNTMKEWIKGGQLNKMYEAAIGVGGDPAVQKKALDVFNALPSIGPGASAADFVKAGYWSTAPKGIEELQNSARYLPGREVKVRTHVHADLSSGRNFMTYDEKGPVGITCRATLLGEKDGKFLVEVEGKKEPIEVSKQEVFDLNQPHAFSPRCNYNDPFTKAKIAEAAILMADDVAKLDFTKMKTDKAGGAIGAIFGRGQGAEKMVDVQKRCFKAIHDVIKMVYDNDGQAGRVSGDSSNAGRAAVRGYGVCTQQRQVMRDLAYPFAEVVGFDLRSVTGGVHRHTNRSDPMDRQLSSFASAAHDWLEVTFRPSMEMTVCDRTWRQCNMSLFEAYGPYGDRYPTSGSYDGQLLKPSDKDVNLSGNISVDNYEKQFGDANTSGRQNHMSNDRNRPQQ